MKSRKIRALVVGLLALGFAASLASGAQADAKPAVSPSLVAPVPGVEYELFTPLLAQTFNICLDDPFGSGSVGNPMQLFHCHGFASNGAPQLWQFVPEFTSSANGLVVYELVNKASGLCLASRFSRGQVTQEGCALGQSPVLWQIEQSPAPNEPNHFLLTSFTWSNACLAAADTSGNNNTAVVLQDCNPGLFFENPAQTWQLG